MLRQCLLRKETFYITMRLYLLVQHGTAWHGTAQNNAAFTLRVFIYVCYITTRHVTSYELCLFT